jgi:phosphoribosylaminoimidazole-succinocarboxamide synthase
MPVATPVIHTRLRGAAPHRQGKVRDIYELGDRMLLVATDRISAFDYVLGSGIPDKGKVLTQLSEFWFEQTRDIVVNHLMTTDVRQYPAEVQGDAEMLAGRSMLVRKTNPVPIECVARGYLSGSGWKDYRTTGTVCGVPLPPGLQESDRLPAPRREHQSG